MVGRGMSRRHASRKGPEDEVGNEWFVGGRGGS